MLASVHLQPAISIPLALLASGWIVWYWMRLGRADVPASRRRIRRVSIIVMAISLPMFVRALSFLDPAIDKAEYVRAWLLASLMVMIVIASALIDAMNNVRLHRAQKVQAIHRAAQELAQQVAARRAALAHPGGRAETDEAP